MAKKKTVTRRPSTVRQPDVIVTQVVPPDAERITVGFTDGSSEEQERLDALESENQRQNIEIAKLRLLICAITGVDYETACNQAVDRLIEAGLQEQSKRLKIYRALSQQKHP